MRRCEDCGDPVVWLKRPDGSWMPPVVPVLDLAYADHFIVTEVGVAMPMPQVYKSHQCLTWEERQLKNYQKEQEKQRLVLEDRERRAEAARVQLEFEQAQAEAAAEEARQQAAIQAALREEREREREEQLEAAWQKRVDREIPRQRQESARLFHQQRLLDTPCRGCEAEQREACRDHRVAGYGTRPHRLDYGGQKSFGGLWNWWKRDACNERFADGPADDRSQIRHVPRWGEDYDEETGQGTTPWTVGPWPPSVADGGRYDVRQWLRANYFDMFETEKHWLSTEEEATLTAWLAIWGDVFEEVAHEDHGRGTEGVDGGRGLAGAEGDGGGHAERPGELEAQGDRVDPEGPCDEGPSEDEHEDRPDQEE